MAEKTVIAAEIKVETGNSAKTVGDLKKDINGLSDGLDKSGKASKSSGQGLSQLKSVIGGLGIVTIIQKGFELFSGALMKNQKVADTVATVMTTIQNVFSAVVGVITSVIDSVSKSSNGFEHLGKVVGGILTLALTPLKLTFFAIKLVIQEAQLAWEKSFFGGNDNDKIAELNKGIGETQTAIVDAGKKAVGAGVDIVKNIGGAVNEVGQVVSKTYDGVSKISVKAIYEQSKATVELQNNAKIAEATLEGVLKKYNTQAEKLRQIRDDDKLSIEDRIKANNELGEVLKKRQEVALALAGKGIAAAQAELNANKGNKDLQAALIRAQNARLDVLDEIAGMESEQKMNSNALTREQIALTKTQSDAEAKAAFDKEKLAASFIENELLRNQTLQAIRDEERESETKRLQDNVNQFAIGTQARVDAEIALKQKIAELNAADDQAKIEREKIEFKRQQDLNAARLQNNIEFLNNEKAALEFIQNPIEKLNKQIELAQLEHDAKIDLIESQRDAEILAAEKAGLDTAAIKDKYNNQIAASDTQLATTQKTLSKSIMEAKLAEFDAVGNAAGALADLIGQQTVVGKGLAVAQAIINTYTGATKAFAQGGILGFVGAAAVIASGLSSVRKILATPIPGAAGGSAGGSAPSISAPVLPQAATTTLNQGQINQIGNTAARAFVLETDVSGNQERVRRLNRAARIN
jgi:hypothetical protein